MKTKDLVKTYVPGATPVTTLRGAGGWELGGTDPGDAVALAFGASVPVDVTASGNLTLTLTTNAAFQLATPTGPATPVLVALRIINTSGGAHGAGTFAAGWKVAGNVTAIATGQNRTYLFMWTGATMFEIVRGAADIPN